MTRFAVSGAPVPIYHKYTIMFFIVLNCIKYRYFRHIDKKKD